MSKSNKSRCVLYITMFILPALLAFPIYGSQLHTVTDWMMFLSVPAVLYGMYRGAYRVIGLFY